MRSDASPIGAVLLDLDCTLYPPECGLLAQVDRNITRFVAQALGLSEHDASLVRVDYHARLGTTLRGLQVYHGVKAEDYHEFIYDLDPAGFVRPDAQVRTLLLDMRVRRVVFTNATAPYTTRVLRALGLAGIFDTIYDIEFAQFIGKPDPVFYLRVADDLGVSPRECLMVDDQRRNVMSARHLGMSAALVSWEDAAPSRDDEIGWVVPSLLALPLVWPEVFGASS